MPMRILVCGGRKYDRTDIVNVCLDTLKQKWGDDLVIIQGGANGADRLAKLWAKANNVRCEEYRADWDNISHPHARLKTRKDGSKYDANAGHRRNQQMIDEGKPDLFVAFPGGPGTADMVQRLRKAGISGSILKTTEEK